MITYSQIVFSRWLIVSVAVFGTMSPILRAADTGGGSEASSWNDSSRSIWDAAWGGAGVKAVLEPNIEEMRKIAGVEVEQKYLLDTEKWLRAALRPELVPPGIAEHAVAVESHILGATCPDAFPKLREIVERKGLSLATFKKPTDYDTGGVLVRYETPRWCVLVVDTTRRLTVLVKDKTGNAGGGDSDQRIKQLWGFLPSVVNETLWNVEGRPTRLVKALVDPDSAVLQTSLIAEGATTVGTPLSTHFFCINLTLPPGPVVKAVFLKRLACEVKPKGPVSCTPKSRFQAEALFDNQDYTGPLPPLPEKPVTEKAPASPDHIGPVPPRWKPAAPASPSKP